MPSLCLPETHADAWLPRIMPSLAAQAAEYRQEWAGPEKIADHRELILRHMPTSYLAEMARRAFREADIAVIVTEDRQWQCVRVTAPPEASKTRRIDNRHV